MKLFKKIIFIFMGFIFLSCGVRGRPQSDQSLQQIGNGKPSFIQKNLDQNLLNKKNKKKKIKFENDFSDDVDGEW